jgi:hypothetical protein
MPRIKKADRANPMEQGVAKQIYQWFIGRLVFHKPEAMSIRDWLEHIFHTKHRGIERYRVRKPFRMPGLYYAAGAVKVQGLGYRDIKDKMVLLVRTDDREPFVDVEVHAGQGNKDQVFQLTSSEWGWVLLHCEHLPERKRR